MTVRVPKRKILIPSRIMDEEKAEHDRSAEDANRDLWYYNHSRCPKCQSELAVTSLGCSVPDHLNKGKCTYLTCGWIGPIAEGVPPTMSTILGKLLRFAHHKKSCTINAIRKSNFHKPKCSCGYEDVHLEAIKAAQRSITQPKLPEPT